MPAPAANFMFSSQFGLAKAYLAAKLCQCSYNTSAVDNSFTQTALNCNSYTVINQQILAPPAIVWNLAPAGYIVSIAGISSTRQFLSYLAQSVATSNTTFTGLCSTFLQYCYNLQKPSILAALGGGSGGPPGAPVFITGHSAGAGIATLLANDLLKNYANAFNVSGCYCFGSPKPGDFAFTDAVSNNTTSTSMRADKDPICTWPSRGTGILASVVGGTLTGRLAYSAWSAFSDLKTCYSIHPSAHVSLREDPNFGSTGDDDLLNLMQSFLENNSLPASHSINNYVNRLYPMGIKEAHGNRWTNVERLLDEMNTVWADNDDTQDDFSTPDLPPISQFRNPSGQPSGSTTTAGGGLVRIAGNATVLMSGSSGQRRIRAKKGDGHTKKRIKQVYQLMQRIQAHDSSVYFGLAKSTQVLLNPAKLSVDELVAWNTMLSALARIVLDQY